MSSTTHIAGPVLVINRRVIQRCAVCGEKLVDSKGMMILLNPNGSLTTISTWTVGSLVQQDGNVWASVPGQAGEDESTQGKYPDDGCIDLVE